MLPNPTYASIYRAWSPSVRRWVRLLGAPEADRDDLVQDIFVVVHRRLVSFDGQNLGGWLYRITQHRVRDYQRMAWVRHSRRTHELSSLTHLLPTYPGPDHDLESRQAAQLLGELLASIGEDQRMAFVLFELEGLAGQEIAEIQNVPINTVWARVCRVRKHLQARIERLNAAASSWRPGCSSAVVASVVLSPRLLELTNVSVER